MFIDLNADLGEGAGFDVELMSLITSANVCCGKHAGGPEKIRATLELAKRHGVAVGAHPGYDDRANFGRREMNLSRSELIDLWMTQINELGVLAQEASLELKYIKPHGALYNQACREESIAMGLTLASTEWLLPLVGLPGSELAAAAERVGLPFIAEGYADRRYRADGSLVPRTEPDAFVHDPDEAVQQVQRLIRDRGIRTVCVHGDNPQAVAFASAVREALLKSGFELKSFA